MADFRSLANLIPNEFGYTPPPAQPDLTTIQRLLGVPQVARAVLQNLAASAASVPVGVYEGYASGNEAGQQAMKDFQAKYGYTPTDPAAQQQLKGLGEFLRKIETDYKIPSVVAPSILPAASLTRASVGQASQGVTRGANISADKLVQMITQNPQATAPQVLQETSMPFLNAVAPKAPSLLQSQKSDLGFYSQLEAATIPLQNKGKGDQYLAQIQKSAGVKPEEIQWTGLDEFLKGKKSVTKTEIQDYLNANRVDVREVRLSDEIDPEEVRLFMADEAGEGFTYDEAVDYLRDGDSVTKFSQYTLPGGENYREILLTLPSGSANTQFAKIASDYAKEFGIPENIAKMELRAHISNPSETPVPARYEQLLAKSGSADQFKSTHFDQPNILAHMRVNDRVVDGKKTLFIEEIQSDWHQAGRKKGYQQPPNESRVTEINQRLRELAKSDMENTPEWDVLTREKESLTSRTGVPDAPFKTSWHELTLKRAIQEASEKGYDQIAFTTGKTQAERYDLSKQVDRIAITKTGGVWAVNAWKDGTKAITKDATTDADLANLVGKELADKAIKQGGGEYAGLDLQVGGEGMKGFYDNILPKSLEKLGKKFDAKVGKTEMDGVDVWQMDITPKMRESVTSKGQPLFAIPAIGTGLLGEQLMQEDQF